VSQDVALFSGTVRSNLDPFSEHSDHDCWDVLERCRLTSKQFPMARGNERTGSVTSLDMVVNSGGSRFSAGQRQLLALARAMLRRSPFVILDEASSAIDLATDDQVRLTG
jgi:ABC-type multidrug transport system fused ATPase/permease subunit